MAAAWTCTQYRAATWGETPNGIQNLTPSSNGVLVIFLQALPELADLARRSNYVGVQVFALYDLSV